MCNNFCMRQKETTSDEQMLSAVLSLTWRHTTLSCTCTHEHTHTHKSEPNHKQSILYFEMFKFFWHWTKIHQLMICCEKQKFPQCSVRKGKQINKYELDHIFFSSGNKTSASSSVSKLNLPCVSNLKQLANA